MAATYPEQDSSRDGRKHPLRGETKEIELDRSRSKKGSNSWLCCGTRVECWRKRTQEKTYSGDAWEEKEEGPTKNNIMTDGGCKSEQCRLELLESDTPCSPRPASMER